MLLDVQGNLEDLDLLDNAGPSGDRLQAMAAVRTSADRMVNDLHHLRRKEVTLMAWMGRLAAEGAFVRRGRGRRRGLDDVGGRRLGGCRGIFASVRQLFLE